MPSKLGALLRLSRPTFLLGGVMGFALGALVARYEGFGIDIGLYVVGQVIVTSTQLTTQYLNEYWDVEADRLNTSRTFFSGGSGVIARGELPRNTALRLALGFSVMFVIAFAFLALRFATSMPLLAVIAGSYLLGCSYSSPPLRLESTGFGELVASLVVAGLLPMSGFMLFTGRLDALMILVVAPLVAFHYAMLLAFDFPDLPSDTAGGKRTLLVRIGRDRGVVAHDALIAAGFVAAAVGVLAGLPPEVALSLLVSIPVVAHQVLFAQHAKRNGDSSFQRFTAGAAALFAVSTVAMAVSFWVLG